MSEDTIWITPHTVNRTQPIEIWQFEGADRWRWDVSCPGAEGTFGYAMTYEEAMAAACDELRAQLPSCKWERQAAA